METLTFTNGQTVSGHCLESGGKLWLYMNGIPFADAIQILLSQKNFETIRASRYGRESVFTGYNHFFCISEEKNGMVNAGIKKD